MEYGHKLRRLAIRSFPRMGHDPREDLVRDQFIQGLEGEMRRHVSLAHPRTLEHAITLATEYDTVTQALRPTLPKKPNLLGGVSGEAPEDPTRDLMKELLEGIKQMNSTKEAPPDNSKNILGDLLEGIKQLAPPKAPRRARLPVEQIECFFCKNLGHYRSDCVEYKQHLKERRQKENQLNH